MSRIRLISVLGLVALAPTAVMLTLGSISPVEAAVRAGATLGCTMIAARMAGRILVSMGNAARISALQRALAAQIEAQRGNASSAASSTTGSNADSAA